MNKAKIILTTTGYTTQLEKSIVLSYIEELEQKVNRLETNISEVIEILNQPMLNYASCVKALDEIEEILGRGGSNE